jgi:hypothetical protein
MPRDVIPLAGRPSAGNPSISLRSFRSSGRRRKFYRIGLVALAAIASAVFGDRAPAATETWSGASSNNWNVAGNWTGTNLPPLAGDTLVFGTSAVTATNNDYAANTLFGGLTFTTGANAFTLGGNAIALNRLTSEIDAATRRSRRGSWATVASLTSRGCWAVISRHSDADWQI